MRETIAITLKNYRCFTDERPATLEVGPGFTAFVGPNNVGKSAVLRFIYEFQGHWNALANPNQLVQLQHRPNSAFGAGLRGVVDQTEVVSDFTNRPLAVELRWCNPAGEQPHVTALTFVSDRSSPVNWRGKVAVAPETSVVHQVEGATLKDQHGRTILWEPFRDLLLAFSNCLFAPAFRNAINEGAGAFYELAVGTSLVDQWNSWKAGDSRAAKLAIQALTEDIRRIFGFQSLEINASANGKTFDVLVDHRPYRLNDLGAGLSQFLILFANVAIRKPALLLIDEPELNLHPSLQLDFLTSLASYSETGSVIFATHSLGLARAAGDRIFTFTPGNPGTIVTQFDATPQYAQFAGEMSYGSLRELGFRTILMVEGPSEIKAVQQFLRLINRDHEVVVMHLGGASLISGGRGVELGELRRVSERIAVLIDSERASADAPLAPERAQFIADCQRLGFLTHVTRARAFENYFPERAIKAAFGEPYRALGPHESLKNVVPRWPKADNWRIARLMTEGELNETDLRPFLDQL